ncbi:MAG: hypothetical protein ACUZ8E_10555 [Candidatus Anammoxibacter sp.]
MFKYGLYILFTLFFASLAYAETHDGNPGHGGHGEHGRVASSINDIAPLAATCTEETAELTNSIDCDMATFAPDCAKISLSGNPVITWTSFDFALHNVVVLKEDVPFDERAVGFDVISEVIATETLPSEYSYNFETGEFIGRPNGEFFNVREPSVSLVNTGPGVYNIWCRYHWLFGMVMKLIVVE